jgi:hypothetical protein
MKVFIGWSGETSKQVAKILHDWLSDVIHSINTFVSFEEIEAGSEWEKEIINNLEEAKVGIFCITPDNKKEWIYFEVGRLDARGCKIIPLLFRVEDQTLSATPLHKFQNGKITQKTMEEVVKSIYETLGTTDKISPSMIIRSIDRFRDTWTQLEDKLKEIPKSIDKNKDALLFNPFQLSACGLKNAFRIKSNDSQRMERIGQLIVEEKVAKGGYQQAEFKLMASSGYNYISDKGIVWGRGLGTAIEDGAKLTIILESPFSSFAKTRALANGVEITQWEDRNITPESLTQLIRDFPGKVSIKITELSVNCSLFFTSKSVFYDPYLWALPFKKGKTENNFWVFEFLKDNNGHCKYQNQCKISMSNNDYLNPYGVLQKHFEFIEKTSVSLKDFMDTKKNGEYELRVKQFKKEIRGFKRQHQFSLQ